MRNLLTLLAILTTSFATSQWSASTEIDPFDGNTTTDGITNAGNFSTDGGTIKLDGNYPTGGDNVAMGDTALDSIQAVSEYLF